MLYYWRCWIRMNHYFSSHNRMTSYDLSKYLLIFVGNYVQVYYTRWLESLWVCIALHAHFCGTVWVAWKVCPSSWHLVIVGRLTRWTSSSLSLCQLTAGTHFSFLYISAKSCENLSIFFHLTSLWMYKQNHSAPSETFPCLGSCVIRTPVGDRLWLATKYQRCQVMFIFKSVTH